ncbi:META domain-containing protein [Chryseobacterium sp. L7]|uniref:META domain-containing protein n=1 Tax=Chryseobacterium endalhagicum TaxID=2797638 RepID=A0ABS1QL49_9FLAO|nr:META domain-containing protein [Chryseobacterium endalhagicum]MBL1222956.1 META domain-containing protein [Chryseobacterium endalhagicum]
MKKIFLIFGVVTALASCKTTTHVKTSNKVRVQPDLDNTAWSLIGDGQRRIPTLHIKGKKINGNTGCNNYFGTITTEASSGAFSVGKIGSTKMACPNPDAEQNFLSLLQKTNKYVINGDNLELYQAETLLLKFHVAESSHIVK